MGQGVVEAVRKDGKGFKAGGDWHGLAFKSGVKCPEKGQFVTFNKDERGYVDQIVVRGGKAPAEATSLPPSATGWSAPPSLKGVALQAAATLIAGCSFDESEVHHIAQVTVAVAQVFEGYMTGGVSAPSVSRETTNGTVASAADLPF